MEASVFTDANRIMVMVILKINRLSPMPQPETIINFNLRNLPQISYKIPSDSYMFLNDS